MDDSSEGQRPDSFRDRTQKFRGYFCSKHAFHVVETNYMADPTKLQDSRCGDFEPWLRVFR